MIEAIAYAIVCFIICKNCTFRVRLKKAVKGAILFVALFFAYNTLQPLLPTEIDHLLYTSIWGVLFAYAVPTEKECQVHKGDEAVQKQTNDKDGEKKEPKEG